MIENTYGYLKRFKFIESIIDDVQPCRVLDIGCGTGIGLTQLLANRFKHIQFVGVDVDQASIEFARQKNQLHNLIFLTELELEPLNTFDLIICSEVLEHVDSPICLLRLIRRKLSAAGHVIITLPNGYGPYEWATVVESLWFFCGGYKLLNKIRGLGQVHKSSHVVDTLAISPHINFFGFRQVCRLVEDAGFKILLFRARTFLCGFGFDHLMKLESIISLNCRIADRLFPQLVSGWMFYLRLSDVDKTTIFSRNFYARCKGYINNLRWRAKFLARY